MISDNYHQNKDSGKDDSSDSEEEESTDLATDKTVSDLDYLKSKKVDAVVAKKEKKQKEPKNETYYTVKITGKEQFAQISSEKLFNFF
jgi:hypothetical protein